MRLALIVMCAVLVLAGCGGHKTQQANDYVKAVNHAQNEFAASVKRLTGKITARSKPGQDRATLRRIETAIDRVVSQLRAVRAPANVRTLHAQFIAAIASYRDVIEKARRAFATKDRRKLVKAQATFDRSLRRVANLIDQRVNQINTKLRQ
jgi:restriction endonuclease